MDDVWWTPLFRKLRRCVPPLLVAVMLAACSSLEQARPEGADTAPEMATTADDIGEATEEATEPAPAEPTDQRRFPRVRAVPAALWLVSLGLAVGTIGGLLAGRYVRPKPTHPSARQRTDAPSRQRADETPTPKRQIRDGATLPTSTGESDAAIEAAIAAWDVADERHRGHLERILNHLNVHRFTPDGERFDPDRHHILSARRGEDATDDMHIAATVRVGWHHADGHIIRPAEVEIWQASTQPHAPDSA